MNAALHRVLVLVTGQPDHMATPDTCAPHGCTGGCNQGRGVCDCELSGDVGPDANRVIQAPIRTPSEQASYDWWARWSKHVAVAAISGLVLLLKLAGAQSL